MGTVTVTIKSRRGFEKDLPLDGEKKVSDIIDNIVDYLDLPRLDDDRSQIIYALYKMNYERINEEQKVAAVLRNGETIYVANIKNPWFEGGTTPPRPKPHEPPPVPTMPTPPLLACRVRVAHDCVHTELGGSVTIDREFLLKNLPPGERIRQEVLYKLTGDSPLMRVSRKNHCEIFQQNNRWFLRAYKPVYVDGNQYKQGQIISLQSTLTNITIGEGGWLVTVELFTP